MSVHTSLRKQVQIFLSPACMKLSAVPFNSQREAEIAYGTLSVDPEPKRGGCKKSLKVEDNTLQIHFDANEAKSLRVGVNSFFDHLNLVVKTIDQFGPPRPLDST